MSINDLWKCRLHVSCLSEFWCCSDLQDFQGFLTDLQDWELSLKEKDKKMKAQAEEKVTLVLFKP